MTRLTILGQVTLFAWFVPGVPVAAWLQTSLGHVSRVAIVPLGWQILLGIVLHAAVILLASPRLVGSYLVSLGVALAANAGALCIIAATENVSLQELLPAMKPLEGILFLLAVFSATLGCFLARREIRNPSLE